ncbi:hypothetical protein C8R43DRAFT_888696 [Mycena crocata]|nr:hypothetical protein C8R43DRAFT_888696 [Mycena crocata]
MQQDYWFLRLAWLEEAGYRLHQDHIKGNRRSAPKHGVRSNSLLRFVQFNTLQQRMNIMDAHRISDGKPVMLKVVSSATHPHEVEIAQFFSSPQLACNLRNHCIPIFQVMEDPEDEDKQIIVMPQLLRIDQPVFDTVGELIDCLRQIFEGIEFMHEHFIAHRDCALLNFDQDPKDLYPHGFYPVKTWKTPDLTGDAVAVTRTDCWPRYYIIDFGLSRRYDPINGPPLEDVILGADKTPPEHRHSRRCNPFPTDIYFLGNLLKREFLIHPPLRFLEPLVNQMTNNDPMLRPTIGTVTEDFDELCGGLSEWNLRQPGQKNWPS